MQASKQADFTLSMHYSGLQKSQLKQLQSDFQIYRTDKEAQITRLLRENRRCSELSQELKCRVDALEAQLQLQALNKSQNSYFAAWENVSANSKELECDISFDEDNRRLRGQVLELRGELFAAHEQTEQCRAQVSALRAQMSDCAALCGQSVSQTLSSEDLYDAEDSQSAESASFAASYRLYQASAGDTNQTVVHAARVLASKISCLRGALERRKASDQEFRSKQRELIFSGYIYQESPEFVQELMRDAPAGFSFAYQAEARMRRMRALEAAQELEIKQLSQDADAMRKDLESGRNLLEIMQTHYVFKDFAARIAPGDNVIDALAQYVLRNSEAADEMSVQSTELQTRNDVLAKALRNAENNYQNALDRLADEKAARQLEVGEKSAQFGEKALELRESTAQLRRELLAAQSLAAEEKKALEAKADGALKALYQQAATQREILEAKIRGAEERERQIYQLSVALQQKADAESEQLKAQIAAFRARIDALQAQTAHYQAQMLEQDAQHTARLNYLYSQIASGAYFAQFGASAAEFVQSVMGSYNPAPEGTADDSQTTFWCALVKYVNYYQYVTSQLRYQLSQTSALYEHAQTLAAQALRPQNQAQQASEEDRQQLTAMQMLQQMVQHAEFRDFFLGFDQASQKLIPALARYVAGLKQSGGSALKLTMADLYYLSPELLNSTPESILNDLARHVSDLRAQKDALQRAVVEAQRAEQQSMRLESSYTKQSDDSKYQQLKYKYRALEKQYDELKAYTVTKKQQCAEMKQAATQHEKEVQTTRAQIKKLRGQFTKEYIEQLIQNRPKNVTHAVLQQLLDEELRQLNGDAQSQRLQPPDLQKINTQDYLQKRRILIQNAASALSHLTYFALTVDRKQNQRYEDAGVLELFVAVCQLSENKELLGMKICGTRQLVEQIGKQLKFIHESKQDAGQEIFQVIKWAQKIAEGAGY